MESIWVYPRARGGTKRTYRSAGKHKGLSPRTRGNLPPAKTAAEVLGSIPAHAGEPGMLTILMGLVRVYPRARGGTRFTSFPQYSSQGLSPRTRGNQTLVVGSEEDAGSIPAHAGEPSRWGALPLSGTVYPRARGGTGPGKPVSEKRQGLSPRTRGNRTGLSGCEDYTRSIPAHAGEPLKSCPSARATGVYPRARGGTRTASRYIAPSWGLSPRTRGNLGVDGLRPLRVGSIPAHAGEPGIHQPPED